MKQYSISCTCTRSLFVFWHKNKIMKYLTVALLNTFIVISVNAQSLTFEKTDEGIWIKENGKNVLFYQAKTKSLEGKYPRANYIHPLFNVNGKVITEDFPKDHLHHRGIFWAWHQVLIGDKKMGDAWECKNFVWDVQQFNQDVVSDNAITFSTHTLWKSPAYKDDQGDMKAFMKERAAMTVHVKKENYRVIDFEISMLALVPDLKIGGSEDQKGYSGFSVRMKMPDDIMFESVDGAVKPITNQLTAGSWMNISGSLNTPGHREGIVIICHPDNPMYPEKWILRKSGSMQNPVYPGRQPISISTTNPTVLKYRLVVYTGDMVSNSILDLKDW